MRGATRSVSSTDQFYGNLTATKVPTEPWSFLLVPHRGAASRQPDGNAHKGLARRPQMPHRESCEPMVNPRGDDRGQGLASVARPPMARWRSSSRGSAKLWSERRGPRVDWTTGSSKTVRWVHLARERARGRLQRLPSCVSVPPAALALAATGGPRAKSLCALGERARSRPQVPLAATATGIGARSNRPLGRRKGWKGGRSEAGEGASSAGFGFRPGVSAD